MLGYIMTQKILRWLAILGTCGTLCLPARADPGYYLVSVYEDEGAVHLDYRYWTVQLDGTDQVVWPELGIGYGVNKRWYTELYTSYIGDAIATSRPSTVNWQNDFLLTQGQYDVDVALHTNLVFGQEGTQDDALEIGPVFQTDVGRVQLNGNLIFEKALAAQSDPAVQLKYQWQAKYRWKAWLHAGLQGFGEVGTWNQWSPASLQSHRWGPVLAGTLRDVGPGRVEYQVAWLGGTVYASDGHMLSLRLQYVY